ncbi:hypothetical protein D3C80_1584090 [compost metagenome]
MAICSLSKKKIWHQIWPVHLFPILSQHIWTPVIISASRSELTFIQMQKRTMKMRLNYSILNVCQ